MEEKWYVFYTKSRVEKKVRDYLQKYGYNVFLPEITVLRQWSDRKKKVTVPLFNSYIFVHLFAHQIEDVIKTPGIVTVIRHGSLPAYLRAKEFAIINRIITSGYSIENDNQSNLKVNDRVEVIEGPLKGLQGIVLDEGGADKIIVHIESISQSLKITVEGFLLRKV